MINIYIEYHKLGDEIISTKCQMMILDFPFDHAKQETKKEDIEI